MYKRQELAEATGVPKDNIIIGEIGLPVEFSQRGLRIRERVVSGQVFVDGLGVGDVGNIVLRDRRQLSTDGIVIVVVTMNKSANKVLAGPDAVSYTHLAQLGKRAQVKVRGVENFHTSGLGARVFQVLAEAHVSVDLIHLSLDYIVFIIDQAKVEIAQQALAPLGLEVEITGGFAKVSVVGAGMHGVPGVMARVVNCLSAEDIPIYQTSDSHANISCLILEEDIGRAVQALSLIHI